MQSIKRLLVPVLLVFVLIIWAKNYFPVTYQDLHPQPTEIAKSHSEKEEFKEKRRAFYEKMHKAAPGTDWRAMDRQHRLDHARKRFGLVRQRLNSRTTDLRKDTLANGQLIGHWRELGSNNQAGRTEFAFYDKQSQALWLASDGGNIWLSDISGTDWRVQNDLLQIPDINFLRSIPTNNGKRLVVNSRKWSSDAFWYSDDNGLTWQTSLGLQGPRSFGTVSRAVVSPDSLHSIYVLVYELGANSQGVSRVYKSVDQGNSFQSLSLEFSSATYGNENRFDLWTDEHAESPVFLLVNDDLYEILPDGSSQLKGNVNPTNSNTNQTRLTGRMHNGSLYLYACYVINGQTNVYQSVDNGENWSFKGSVNTNLFARNSFAVAADDPNVLYTGGIDAFRSLDGGVNWNMVNGWAEYYSDPVNKLHADIPGFNSYINAQGQEFTLINTDGGLYISYDHLNTVQNISLSGLNVSQYYSTYTHQAKPEIVYAGAQDQGFQKSKSDNGSLVNFDQIISGDYGHISSGDGGKTFWTTYPGFSMFSSLATASQPPLMTYDFDGDGHLWLPPILADPDDPFVAYRAGGSSSGSAAHIFKLTANSNNITSEEQTYDFSLGSNASISALAISPILSSIRYVMNDNGNFFSSLDAGNTWNITGPGSMPGSHYFYGNTIIPSNTNPGKVYVGGSGYSNSPVYVSTNNGGSFTPMNNGLPNTLVFKLASTPDDALIFAATEVGPYVYVAADDQWYSLSGLSAPDQTYWSVEYVPALHAARFATYGRGIWDFFICDEQSPEPEALFLATEIGGGTTITFTNLSKKAYFYTWDLGDGTQSTEKQFTHLFGQTGVYPIRLIASTHCSTDTFEQTLYLASTGLADDLETGSFKLFPNPAKDVFILENVEKDRLNVHVSILSLDGKLVYQEFISQFLTADTKQISLKSVPVGIYFVQLSRANGQLIDRWKLLVQ